MSHKSKLKADFLEAQHTILQIGRLNGVTLVAPASFWLAAPGRRQNVCNGCGPGGWKWDIVPDTMYGLSVRDACDIHDWMYCHGKTVLDKDNADKVFKANLYQIIEKKTSFWPLKILRRIRACWYYLAVSWLGHAAFWKGKQ